MVSSDDDVSAIASRGLPNSGPLCKPMQSPTVSG